MERCRPPRDALLPAKHEDAAQSLVQMLLISVPKACHIFPHLCRPCRCQHACKKRPKIDLPLLTQSSSLKGQTMGFMLHLSTRSEAGQVMISSDHLCMWINKEVLDVSQEENESYWLFMSPEIQKVNAGKGQEV